MKPLQRALVSNNLSVKAYISIFLQLGLYVCGINKPSFGCVGEISKVTNPLHSLHQYAAKKNYLKNWKRTNVFSYDNYEF